MLKGTRTTALVALAGLVASGAMAQTQTAPTFVRLSADQGPPRAREVHVLRERRVDLDLAVLGGAGSAYAQRMRLEFFPDVSYTAILDRVTHTADGVTWSGHLAGLPLSTAVFARVGGAITGSVASRLGQFTVESDGLGGYTVQQIDSGISQQLQNDAIIPPAIGPSTGLRLAPRRASAPSHDAVVDVLVVYTENIVALQGGGIDALEAKTHVMIGVADTAFRAAGTGGVRLARMRQVEWVGAQPRGDDESSRAEMLNQLQQLDAVRAARDQYAADVVTLLWDAADTHIGGFASLLTRDQDTPGDYAFNVIDYRLMLFPVYSHELGHTMGLSHDWYDGGGKGWRPSSNGFTNHEERFYTIMATAGSCYVGVATTGCLSVPFFSDPNRSFMGVPIGVPIGTNLGCTAGNADNPPCDADAVSTLAETAPIVAGYRHHRNRLTSGQSLGPGQILRANGAACSLAYQGDGNLVARYTDRTAYWASGTGGGGAGSMVMQHDGNLVLRDAVGTPVWATHTGGNSGASVAIQRDCNIVVRATEGTALWASGVKRPPPPRHPITPIIYSIKFEPTTVEWGSCSTVRWDADGVTYSSTKTTPNGTTTLQEIDEPLNLHEWSFAVNVCPVSNEGAGNLTFTITVFGDEGTTPVEATATLIVTAP